MMQMFNEDFLTMSLRLILAVVLSGIIGFEREINKHAAGFRTHILVGVSSCLAMLMSLYGFQQYADSLPEFASFDPARIPSYVISGIGFLGAGTIIVTGMNVKGLTTAASIWAVAGLGLVVGIGMIDIALLTTFIIIFSLFFLNNMEKWIRKQDHRKNFIIKVTDLTILDEIFTQFLNHDISVKNISYDKSDQDNLTINADVILGKNTLMNEVFHDLLKIDKIIQVKEDDAV